MMEGAPPGLHLGGLPAISVDGDTASVSQNADFVDAATLHEVAPGCTPTRSVRTERGLAVPQSAMRVHRRRRPGRSPPAAAVARPADDEAAILRTLTDYCIECDDAQFDVLAERFTEDAVLVMPDEAVDGVPLSPSGSRPRRVVPSSAGKHLTTNVRYDIAGDHATVIADFAWLKFTREARVYPATIGRYADELERSDGRWRFRRREIRLLSPPGRSS